MTPIEPRVEAAHLRRLIESQPTCLMRVGLDGGLLAVNEAAQKMLGAAGLTAVLGTFLGERVAPAHRQAWKSFTDRLAAGKPGSLECVLLDLAGAERTILMQGVPLLDHPDRVPSMILALRDVTSAQRLETVAVEQDLSKQVDLAVLEHGFTSQIAELQAELERARAEGGQLEAMLAEARTDEQRHAAEHAAERARLQQTLAEEHQLALMLRDREAQQRINDLLARLDGSKDEVQQQIDELVGQIDGSRREIERLTGLLAESETSRTLLTAEQQAVRAAMQAEVEALTAQFAADRAALEAAFASERQAAEERVAAERDASLAELAADDETERIVLQQVLEDRHAAALASLEESARQRESDLRAALDASQAEAQRLQSALASGESAMQQLLADQAVALADLERILSETHSARLADERRLFDEARAEIERSLTAAHDAALADALARHQAAHADLERNFVDTHQSSLADERRRHDQARVELEHTLLAAHQAALLQEQAQREQLEAELRRSIAEERTEREVLKAQLEQVLAEGMRLGQMLEESEAEATRLNRLVDDSAKTREQLEAEHEMERLRVTQTLVDEHQRAMQQREQEARQRIDDLKATLQATLGESQRLEMLIEKGQAERRNLVADHDAARAVAERALAAAAEQSDRIAQALAVQRAELQISEDQTRRLEPLAAAGRLALEISRELQDVLTSLDDRARRLLAGAVGSATQTADRDMIEAVRRDAVRAASLARQVVQAQDGKLTGSRVASDSPLTPVETKRSF